MIYKVYFICSMIIFGSIGLIVREIPLSSAEIAMVRGVIGSTFLIVTASSLKKKPSLKKIKRNLIYLAISGGALGINWILLFEAYRYTSITNATLSYYLAPVIVVLMSPILLKEKLSLQKLLCVLVAMAGMILLVWTGRYESFYDGDIKGIGFGLAAATFYALVVLMNKLTKDIDGLGATIVQLTLASFILIPYVLSKRTIPWNILGGNAILRLLVVGFLNTGIAYLLYFSSVQKLKSQTVAILSYIDPVSALVMSAVFIGEKITIPQLLGGILILGSALICGRDSLK